MTLEKAGDRIMKIFNKAEFSLNECITVLERIKILLFMTKLSDNFSLEQKIHNIRFLLHEVNDQSIIHATSTLEELELMEKR